MTRFFRVLFWASVACLIATVVLRPLWYDEILGHWMATLQWPEETRAATRAGIDLQPPGWYLLVQLSEALTGNAWGPRVFSLLGVVGASILMGRLARERWGAEIGHIASAALLLTGAHEYAWEGRPYGLLLGAAALAFFAWCRVVEDRRRTLWLPVLGLALLCAVQLHYFAVVLWFPLAVGELVRARIRGRIDLAVLAVATLPLVSLIALLPDAMTASELMRVGPFSKPSFRGLGDQYKILLGALMIVLIAAPLVVVCHEQLSRHRETGRRIVRDPRNVAIAAFLLLPFVAMLMTVLGGSGISHQRYALAFTLGASLATAGFVYAIGLKQATLQRVVGLAALLMLFLCARDASRAWRRTSRLEADIVLQSPAGIPEVHPPGSDGLEVWQNASAVTRSRMLLAADPQIAASNGSAATVDVNLTGSRGFFPFPVASWSEIQSLGTAFVFVQRKGARNWVFDAIIDSGAHLERVSTRADWEAWLVHMPGSKPGPDIDAHGAPPLQSKAGG